VPLLGTLNVEEKENTMNESIATATDTAADTANTAMAPLTWEGKWTANTDRHYLGGEVDGHCMDCSAQFFKNTRWDVRAETSEGEIEITVYAGGGVEHDAGCTARGGHAPDFKGDIRRGVDLWIEKENQRRTPHPPAHVEEVLPKVDQLEVELKAALSAVTRASNGPFHTERAWQQTPAHKLWLKATKQQRHEQRLAATIAAARLTAVQWGLSVTTDGPEANVMLALLVDSLGFGGHLGLEGSGTHRPGAFGRLGKGRKQASDYPCWAYAAQLAWQQANPNCGRVALLVYPASEDGPGYIVLDVEGLGEAAIPPVSWMVPLLGRLLLCSLGMMEEVHPLVHVEWARTGEPSAEEREVIEAAYNAAARKEREIMTPTSSGDDW